MIKYNSRIILLYVLITSCSLNALIYLNSAKHDKQLLWLLIAIICFFIINLIDSSFYHFIANPAHYGCIILAIITAFIGENVYGHNAWIGIGGIKGQSSEFLKLTCALALSNCLCNTYFSLKKRKIFLKLLTIIIAPMCAILLQGDFGSTITFGAFILVLYREGLSPFIILCSAILLTIFLLTLVLPVEFLMITIIVISILLVLILNNYSKRIITISSILFGVTLLCDWVIKHLFKQYHRDRIKTLFDDSIDYLGIGWNIIQSKVAISAGGMFGKNVDYTQSQYGFVPVQSKDFIFCFIAEKYGFIGCTILIVIYTALVIELINMAEKQISRFNRVYMYSVASLLFFHFFVNIGMTMGLLPVIGIPLPLVSYGGSSFLAFSIMIFIALKLNSERKF